MAIMGRQHVRRDANGEPLPEDAPKCGAKRGKKRVGNENFCQNAAGWGTDHPGVGPCRYHMGATPAVSAKYKEIALKQKGQQLLVRLDVEPVDNPLLELAMLAGQVVAWKNAMADRVNAILEIVDEDEGRRKNATIVDRDGNILYQDDIRFTNKDGTEQLRSEVALWERALARCESVLVNIAKLNIDERLAQIDERQAEIVTQALLATINGLNWEQDPAELKREARRTVGQHLRRIS